VECLQCGNEYDYRFRQRERLKNGACLDIQKRLELINAIFYFIGIVILRNLFFSISNIANLKKEKELCWKNFKFGLM